MSVALDSGSSFAGYQIESVVGRGGMGVVYRATDLSLQRPVALKLVAPELAGDELFRRRFLKEPRLAASLDHPNVVPIYEAGEHDGQLYLAMRFVDGSDMRTLLRREGGLPAERALDILAQVAGALDAAHRRGLVHRDVKPANVLVDEDGHAYLTDFGVTKQLGGNTTETGQIVGTLDYVAPEQIRGEDVDARADGYALACVLYECLAGAPPFHRATEAETLWAHMQEPPPPLPGLPALDRMMVKALAKDPGDRYASCGELIADARAALAHPIVPTRLLRRRHAILAAGVLMLAATAVAFVLASRDGGSAALRGSVLPTGDGLAAIRADGKRIASFTGADAAPSNIAVGEGSVWMLNTADARVSRVDPRTGEVIRSFEPRGRPTDIAAGAGALWIGGGPGATHRVSRVDPATGEPTRTVRLPGGGEPGAGDFSEGFPGIAVGADAVWAINPDSTVSRLDPASGRRVAVVRGTDGAGPIAAGDAGVWVISGENTIAQIDPRTNRMRKAIELGSNQLFGIAVGGGAVWATSEEGVLWRVEPGPAPDRAHDRGRRRRALRRVRRRRGVGGELERQHRLARGPGDQPGHRAGAGRRRPGARSRRRLGVGQRRGRVQERRAAGERLRRVDRRGRGARRVDRLEPAATGGYRRPHAHDGRRDSLRAPGPRVPGGRAHGRLPLVRRLDGAER